jgi:hypothetical protein
VSIDEAFCGYASTITDDEMTFYLEPINAATITLIMEPCFSGGFVWDIATVAANVSTFSDNNLSKNKTYYRVCAYNVAGNSAYSNTGTASKRLR